MKMVNTVSLPCTVLYRMWFVYCKPNLSTQFFYPLVSPKFPPYLFTIFPQNLLGCASTRDIYQSQHTIIGWHSHTCHFKHNIFCLPNFHHQCWYYRKPRNPSPYCRPRHDGIFEISCCNQRRRKNPIKKSVSDFRCIKNYYFEFNGLSKPVL